MKELNLRFPHKALVSAVVVEADKELTALAKEYGLTLTREADQKFLLKGRGVNLTAEVVTTEVVIAGGVGLPASLVFGRIKTEVEDRIPKLIERCG